MSEHIALLPAQRYIEVAGIVHQKTWKRKSTLLQTDLPPDTLLENKIYTVCWDTEVMTFKTIPRNRPDVIFVNKETKEIYTYDRQCHT
jgi:hypothetical protein